MTGPAAIAWESLALVAAAFGLAVWALRDTDAASAPRTGGPLVARLRLHAAGEWRVVDVADAATLGRGYDCAVVLDDATVSKHHARVGIEGRAWIEDLQSTNGTFVNGHRIEGITWLRRGDRIALGTAKIVFLGLVSAPTNGPKG